MKVHHLTAPATSFRGVASLTREHCTANDTVERGASPYSKRQALMHFMLPHVLDTESSVGNLVGYAPV